MPEQTITGAHVILPGAIEETTVTISEGQITGIGGAARGEDVDGRGLYLAPALVDVHGDAFERQVMPRPGVFVPLETAVLETDRQLAANGIATAYHALTLSWEPGLRSVARGRSMIEALQNLAPRLTVENRVQLRWETFATEAIETLIWAMSGPLKPSLAFNDHLSMEMRSLEISRQDRAFEHSETFVAADPGDPRLRERWVKTAAQAGLPLDDFMDLVASVWERRDEVPGQMQSVAALAREYELPMLSHDDSQIEARQFFRDLGATTAEFPMTLSPTKNARASGDAIIFGAPNVLRGGSHIGSLGAADMVEDGLCDALASDYYYPALLAAVARLNAERRAPLADLWSLVSSGPAKAMGLLDRGEIAPGKRADLILLDWPEGKAPAVRATYVAGRPAYRAAPAE